MKTVVEESAEISVGDGKLSKKMGVFYNPVMKLNRDISILLLNSLGKKDMQIADPLAGSGVRAIRFLKELKRGIVEHVYVNDYSKDVVKVIGKNFKLNKIKKKDVGVSSEDATLFLLNGTGFDYIDIDPFGSPVPFLDAAMKRIARGGVLAVTATDTSALAGTYPQVCKRRYWATPMRNYLMHEVGLRILIRKVQLIGMQYDKAVIPIFSYSKDHYYRLFFRVEKSKDVCGDIVKQHAGFYYCPSCMQQGVEMHYCGDCGREMIGAGPLWIGELFDAALVKKMVKGAGDDVKQFVSIISDESKLNVVGFYDLHVLGGKLKKKIIRTEDALKKLGKYGSKTHFSGHSVKTSKSVTELIRLLYGRR